MEIIVFGIFFAIYLAVKIYTTDHETRADKDRLAMVEGIELFQKKDFENAFNYFDKAVKANKKSAVALGYRGLCNLQFENYYTAIYDLTQSMQFDNTLYEFQLGKGRAHYALNEWQDALIMFDKAVWYSQRKNVDALRWRAITLLKINKKQKAKADLELAQSLGDKEATRLLLQLP
jgi:tetratricopeptide (TPR) repeat protein